MFSHLDSRQRGCRFRAGSVCALGLMLAAGTTLTPTDSGAAEPTEGRDRPIPSPRSESARQSRSVTLHLTYYWIAEEVEGVTRPSVVLRDRAGHKLATVTQAFATTLAREGTGRLLDGRLVNIGETCAEAPTGYCYFVVDEKEAPFGWGSHAPLMPFRSVAARADNAWFAPGEVVYIPELDGAEIPWQGRTVRHDGCVQVVDLVPHLESRSLDLFVAAGKSYRGIARQLGPTVTATKNDRRCGADVTALAQ